MDTLKRIAKINGFLAAFLLLWCSQGWAEGGVLQSSANTQNREAEKSKLVSSDSQFSNEAAAPQASSGPKQTITLKFVPKNPPASQPAVPQTSKLPPSYETADDTGIFKKENPHAVKPEVSSPFIKQVTANVPSPYINQKARVFSPGKPANTTPGNVIDVRSKQALSSSE